MKNVMQKCSMKFATARNIVRFHACKSLGPPHLYLVQHQTLTMPDYQ